MRMRRRDRRGSPAGSCRGRHRHSRRDSLRFGAAQARRRKTRGRARDRSCPRTRRSPRHSAAPRRRPLSTRRRRASRHRTCRCARGSTGRVARRSDGTRSGRVGPGRALAPSRGPPAKIRCGGHAEAVGGRVGRPREYRGGGPPGRGGWSRSGGARAARPRGVAVVGRPRRGAGGRGPAGARGEAAGRRGGGPAEAGWSWPGGRAHIAPLHGGRRRRVVAYASMEEVLETERLRLSPLTEADLDDLVELDGDPEVRRRVDPLGIIIPLDSHERRTYEWERFVAAGGFYAARERVGNAFVGWFQLEEAPDREDEAELGYRFRRNAWGLGYATEGARALVAHALDVLGYRRVFAHALLENAASIRVMEKAGLRPAGPWSYRELPGVEYAIERDGPAADDLRGAAG